MGLLINGRSLDDLVWQHVEQMGHLAPAVARRPVVDRGDGAPTWTSRLTAAERIITQTVDIRPVSLEARVALLDTIRARCAGVCELIATDAPDRRWWGVLDSLTVELVTPADSSPVALVALRWRCQDARAEAIEPDTYALSATPITLALGVSASAPVVVLVGASTPVVDPEIVLTYANGARESRLTLTASLGTGVALEIDAARESVWRTDGGTRTAALSAVRSGLFPIADPEDGPITVALASASGTPTGWLSMRRMW